MKKILIKHADGTTNVIEGENLRFDINNAIVIFEETDNEKRLIAHLPLSATCINLNFLASANVTKCSNLDKIKFEIKSTSELGCMLDTERAWNTDINLIQPNDTRDVEVMLKDGTITFGWFGGCWWVDNKIGYKLSCHFPEENPNNPVVAWRELVTNNK